MSLAHTKKIYISKIVINKSSLFYMTMAFTANNYEHLIGVRYVRTRISLNLEAELNIYFLISRKIKKCIAKISDYSS